MRRPRVSKEILQNILLMWAYFPRVNGAELSGDVKRAKKAADWAAEMLRYLESRKVEDKQ